MGTIRHLKALHTHGCFQLVWLIRYLVRLKLDGAMLGIMCKIYIPRTNQIDLFFFTADI